MAMILPGQTTLQAVENAKQDILLSPTSVVPSGALSESSPLLARARNAQSFIQSFQRDPQGFVVSLVKKPVLSVLGPVLSTLPTIEEDVDRDAHRQPYGALGLEICILLKHSVPTCLYVSYPA